MNNVSEAIVLILGSTGNLGQACAEIFCQQDAHLVLVDRSDDRLRDTFATVDGAKRTLVGGIDLSDEEAMIEMVADVNSQFGRIDVLINTVGAFQGGRPVQEESIETWDMLLKINLYIALIASRAVLPIMLNNHAGRIINVVSRNAFAGVANYAAYSAAKAALLRLSESLAAELKAHDITVNCVVPGTIDTPQNRKAMPDADVSHWVTPTAIANVINFLASEAAHAVTGAAIPVYGRG